MDEIRHFIPGQGEGTEDFVARLRWPIPVGVAGAYLQAYSRPGERVLVPFCQGPGVVHEVLAMGRQPIAVNFDPLLTLLAQVALNPLPSRDLDAAVTRLGDSTKQGVPLRRYLQDLYATSCPACLRPAVADYFVWDREMGEPVAKHVRCPVCAWDGQSGIDVEDRERLVAIEPRGMHYHYVLDRLAPESVGPTLRNRLQTLLELYSPRNQYALAELSLKVDGLFPEGALHQALLVLLLDCLDRCSSLAPLPGRHPQRHGLSRPARFLEYNVWLCLEEALGRLRSISARPATGLAESLAAFQARGEGVTGFVGQWLVRDLARTLAPRSLRLVLTSPPPLSPAAWALSYLWGGWLLGPEAVIPLRPLLRQRTADPAWYARVMAGSFSSLADLLADDGRLVMILTGQRPAVLEALMLAAAQARLGVASLVQCDSDYRLVLTPSPSAPRRPSPDPLETQIRQAALEASIETIQARGEPTAWRTLHAAIQRRLGSRGLLARAVAPGASDGSPLDLLAEKVQAALDDPTLLRLPGPDGNGEMYWLADASAVARPLSDRVEIKAHELLEGTAGLSQIDFARALYAQFPDALTPDAALVAACLQAYGREAAPGVWILRSEDQPATREAERRDILEELQALGQRLGFRAGSKEPFDVAWFEGKKVRSVFCVRWQATLSEVLDLGEQAGDAWPYLVIPGGRAPLANHKLTHNPLWQQAVDEAGWSFIKYRHVRQLAAQTEVDEYALRTIVGLDPIVEKEGAQIPLF
ncbi:MAG: hypothetical protein M8467_07100 [Anaerolineae bacterium]|nr:hypothetical protein [Anaerolineae bacterium]